MKATTAQTGLVAVGTRALILVFSLFTASHVVAQWTFVRLTNDQVDDTSPSADGIFVAWSRFDGNDYEIMYWDGTTVRQLTDNSFDDVTPSVSQGKIAWCQLLPTGIVGQSKGQVFFWDGIQTTNITDGTFDPSNSLNDVNPKLVNGQIVWLSTISASDQNIFKWDAGIIQSLTSTTNRKSSLDFDGTNVVWQQENGSGYDIYKWSAGVVQAVTSDVIWDRFPAVLGNRIVWERDEASPTSTTTILQFDGNNVSQVTSLPYGTTSASPAIGNSFVAWVEDGGSILGTQVAISDAQGKRLLTDVFRVVSVRGSGTNFVIEALRSKFADDREVYIAVANPPPKPRPVLAFSLPSLTQVQLNWVARAGYSYRVERSLNITNWSDISGPLTGPDNSDLSFEDFRFQPQQFYRVRVE